MAANVPEGERSRLTVAGRRRHHVIVAGGGVAALEAVLALRELGSDHVSITLLAPGGELLYRPVTVAEAFGRGEARTFQIDEILYDQGVDHVHDSLERVQSLSRTVLTGTGDELAYDSLVIAVGARQTPVLPGALAFGGRADVPALRQILDDLLAGSARSVAFTLASPQEWPMPIYELALLTADHLREYGSPAHVTLVTPEERPLALFGPEADRTISSMLSILGVTVRCSAMPAFVRLHELVLAGGGIVSADRVVTLPGVRGPHIAGVASDDHGFIP
ncbi:MAG TPA: FAD-dependent oxidoreductase, partial [Solirubrobacteraceae bacterium]|nr:FAD-dependent oxidoreductase [Solirubrobacteraceae bacterium]